MTRHPHDPPPLEYGGDAAAPGGGIATWVLVVVVWAVGLASWTLWTGACIYGFFRFFS